MNPLSALIGGGLSLIGGLMNTSSTQAINAANLQQQMNMAQGAYLPGLRRNAEAAGFNPLAVLGMHAPTGGTAVPIGAGEGLTLAGRSISQMDPVRSELDRYTLESARQDVELKNVTTKNAAITAAVNQNMLDRLNRHPEWVPSSVQEPATSTGLGIPQLEWLRDKVRPPKAVDLPVRAPSFDERYQLF